MRQVAGRGLLHHRDGAVDQDGGVHRAGVVGDLGHHVPQVLVHAQPRPGFARGLQRGQGWGACRIILQQFLRT